MAKMSVFLAYDGSLNGDWIGRYAVRFAAGTPARHLTLLHIEDANVSGSPLHQRLVRLESVGRNMGVMVETRILPMHEGVYGGLDEHLPKGPETLVVCGARASAGRRGVLSGTISERLLAAGNRNVMAIRVLQPGLLGVPHRVLLPLSAGRDAAPALPFLAPMASDLERLDILFNVTVSHRRFANMTEAAAARLKHDAQTSIDEAEQVLVSGGVRADIIDGHVRVTNDSPKQTAVEAGRYRTGLILTEMPTGPAPLTYAHPIEELMRISPTDVAAFRSTRA